jgi:hypothetical protein
MAYGHGRFNVIRPSGGHAFVRGELRAENLGRCFGLRAYRRVDYRVYFRSGTALFRRYGKDNGRWAPYVGLDGDVCRATKYGN